MEDWKNETKRGESIKLKARYNGKKERRNGMKGEGLKERRNGRRNEKESTKERETKKERKEWRGER